MADPVAEFYLVLEGKRAQYGPVQENGLRPVEAVRAIAIKANQPKSLSKDQIYMKIRVQVPSGAFDPITPSALIVVPEDLISKSTEIVVEALDPYAGMDPL